MQATVKSYEVGASVITSNNPDLYLQELKQINVQARILQIKEDVHYKEYKQYSTQRDKDKRIVYIFYNKTFEARSKAKDTNKKDIPENVLRFEKDNRRPIEKISFARLFENDFIQFTFNEFKQRFVEDLEYKSRPIKPTTMSHQQFRMIELLFEIGKNKLLEQTKEDFNKGVIKKTCYYERLQFIEQMSETQHEIKTEYTAKAAEFNNLIISKINYLSALADNFSHF
jgi:hypothetical protein